MSDDGALQWGWKSVKVAGTRDTEVEEAAPAEAVAGTFIGSGALFEGTLQLRGDFRIDNEFRGELNTDGKITVGPSGSVVGNISAREVEVFGAVVGDVSARREVILHAGARLHGGITTACLEVARHAFFNGTTSMTEPQTRSRQPATPAPQPTESAGFAG